MKERARMSNLLKSTDLASLVKANNITDFIVSKQSDNEAFTPNSVVPRLHPRRLNILLQAIYH